MCMPVEYDKGFHCLSESPDLQAPCMRLQVLPLRWSACLISQDPSAVIFFKNCVYRLFSPASRGPCTFLIEQHKFMVMLLNFEEKWRSDSMLRVSRRGLG